MSDILASTDGRFIRSYSGAFATARIGGGTIAVITPTGTNPDYLLGARYDLTASHLLYRAFLFFDLSGIAAGTKINGDCQLKIYVYSVDNEDLGFPNIVVCEGKQSNPVVTGDFNDQNAEVTNHGEIDTGGITASLYNTITLDASGKALVEAAFGGTLKLCLMDQRDNENNDTGALRSQGIYFYMTQQGSGYEPKLSFSVGPRVTTQVCTNTIAEKSTGHGTIISEGGSNCTQHGHCWSTSHEPTTSDSKTENGEVFNLGQFESAITGLTPNTTYYVRAYATNSEDTAYGAEVTIPTDATIGRRFWWTEKERFYWWSEWGDKLHVDGIKDGGS